MGTLGDFVAKKKKTLEQKNFTKVLKIWAAPRKAGSRLLMGEAIKKKNLQKITKRYKAQGYSVLPKTSSGGPDYRSMAIKLRTPKLKQN